METLNCDPDGERSDTPMPKGKRARTVDLSADTVALLRDYKREQSERWNCKSKSSKRRERPERRPLFRELNSAAPAHQTPTEPSGFWAKARDAGKPRSGARSNQAIICPQCQMKGHVRALQTKRKVGSSGAKATGALLAAGWSLLATGLSRKQQVTQAHCDNCGSTWDFYRRPGCLGACKGEPAATSTSTTDEANSGGIRPKQYQNVLLRSLLECDTPQRTSHGCRFVVCVATATT